MAEIEIKGDVVYGLEVDNIENIDDVKSILKLLNLAISENHENFEELSKYFTNKRIMIDGNVRK